MLSSKGAAYVYSEANQMVLEHNKYTMEDTLLTGQFDF